MKKITLIFIFISSLLFLNLGMVYSSSCADNDHDCLDSLIDSDPQMAMDINSEYFMEIDPVKAMETDHVKAMEIDPLRGFEVDEDRALEYLDENPGALIKNENLLKKFNERIQGDISILNGNINLREEWFSHKGIGIDNNAIISSVDSEGNVITSGSNAVNFKIEDLEGKGAKILEDGSLVFESGTKISNADISLDNDGVMVINSLNEEFGEIIISNSDSGKYLFKGSKVTVGDEEISLSESTSVLIEREDGKTGISINEIESGGISYSGDYRLESGKITIFDEGGLELHKNSRMITYSNMEYITKYNSVFFNYNSCTNNCISDNGNDIKINLGTNSELDIINRGRKNIIFMADNIGSNSKLSFDNNGFKYDFTRENGLVQLPQQSIINDNYVLLVSNEYNGYRTIIPTGIMGNSQIYSLPDNFEYEDDIIKYIHTISNPDFTPISREKTSIVDALSGLGLENSLAFRKELYQVLTRGDLDGVENIDINSYLLNNLKRGNSVITNGININAENVPEFLQDGEFLKKVEKVAERLGTTPENLLSVMHLESAGTFDPCIKNFAGSGATGLIQFMPRTAEGLGTSTDDLCSMNRVQQMDYVEKYFQPYKNRGLDNINNLYMAVLCPAVIGEEIFAYDKTRHAGGINSRTCNRANNNLVYTQNRGLDRDNNGIITVEEIVAKLGTHQRKVQNALEIYDPNSHQVPRNSNEVRNSRMVSSSYNDPSNMPINSGDELSRVNSNIVDNNPEFREIPYNNNILVFDNGDIPNNVNRHINNNQWDEESSQITIIPQKTRINLFNPNSEVSFRPNYSAIVISFENDDILLYDEIEGIQIYLSVLLENGFQFDSIIKPV